MRKSPGRINIVSEGTGQTTHVVFDDGTEVTNVARIALFAYPDSPVDVELKILLPVVNMTAEVKKITYHCQFCKQIIDHMCGEE